MLSGLIRRIAPDATNASPHTGGDRGAAQGALRAAMFRLDGKAALITGASGGIGDSIATTLHAQGAIVALSGTRRDALDWWLPILVSEVSFCPGDLRDAAEPDALVEAAEQAAGPLAILVNNAGMTRDMLALRMRDEDWQSVMDVDLSAPVPACTGGVARDAAAAGGTHHQHFVDCRRNRQRWSGQLSAAKAGLIGMTKALAQEVAVARRDGERRGARADSHLDDRAVIGAAASQAGEFDPVGEGRQR